jgi:membrane protein
MALTSVVGAMSQYIGSLISLPGWAIWVFNGVLSLAVITALFALMFKYLPDVKIHWGDVWVGALGTTILFLIGQFVLGWYLGRQSTTSAYGAAGSVVVILLYLYYSSLILFVGAEFTKAYAYEHGSQIRPVKHAIFVNEVERAQQGRPTQKRIEEASRNKDEHGDDSHQMPKAA